ncbi:MAG: host-nuclease inhibitor Gam family protein [Verrucomicrobiota bacterium]|jgi:phage host-nuclease inhibitor protein Gam
MKTNRIKNTQPLIRTREALESLIGEIAAIKNRQRLLTAAMDEQIQSIRGQFEPELAAQNQSLEEKMEHARVWSEANPQEFGAGRSIQTVHGVLGWRMGGPSLRTLAGWTWDRVKETLKAANAVSYIRVKEEVNKQNLLADRESIGVEKLRDIGLRVVQEETFFVEPKLTEIPAPPPAHSILLKPNQG